MKETLLAYLAGCIDCDGSISIKRSTYAMRVRGDAHVPVFSERVMFAQVYSGLPELLKQTFGGSYQIQKSPSTNGRPVYHWQVTDRQAVACVKALLPYLQVKQKQAEMVLELRQLKELPRVVVGSFSMNNHWGKHVMMPLRVVDPVVVQAKEKLFCAIKQLNDVRSRQPRLIGTGLSGHKGGDDKNGSVVPRGE